MFLNPNTLLWCWYSILVYLFFFHDFQLKNFLVSIINCIRNDEYKFFGVTSFTFLSVNLVYQHVFIIAKQVI